VYVTHRVAAGPWRVAGFDPTGAAQLGGVVDTRQGLTLVHYSAQRKHILWDTLGA